MEILEEVKREFIVFHKQVDMFEYQKKSMPKGRCFSFEVPSPLMPAGGRKFFLSDLNKFWFWYRNLYRLPRHFYEMIQENYPCRLYFDLEYKKSLNVSVDEHVMLSDFLRFVCSFVRETFMLDITEKSFVLLDSTTVEKFSVHAICHFPNNYLFPNNVVMREFVAQLTERMSKSGIGIIKKEGGETFICDSAVYTKNRSFRILLSSKGKKEATFNLRQGCQFYDEIPNNDKQIFLDSLVIPADFSSAPILDVNGTKNVAVKHSRTYSMVLPHPNAGLNESADHENLLSGVAPSIFPELDDHVRTVITTYKKGAEIKSWTLFRLRASGLIRMQYLLNNCRYCLRIQREHASNNVYWICQLGEKWMMQKCYDYECRDFVSKSFPITKELIEKIKPKLDLITVKKPWICPTVIPLLRAEREPPLPRVPRRHGSSLIVPLEKKDETDQDRKRKQDSSVHEYVKFSRSET